MSNNFAYRVVVDDSERGVTFIKSLSDWEDVLIFLRCLTNVDFSNIRIESLISISKIGGV